MTKPQQQLFCVPIPCDLNPVAMKKMKTVKYMASLLFTYSVPLK